MIDLDFTFEQAPWEVLLDSLHRGDKVSAMKVLSVTEEEEEDTLEQVFTRLEEMGVTLDLSRLPGDMGFGQTSLRLRQEKQLCEGGDLLKGLEERDTLRLYLEELPDDSRRETLKEAFLAGDSTVASQLLDASLSSVVELAKEYVGRGVLLLDLIQDGSLGLWQGLQTWQDGDFEAHCQWWIRQYMARAVILAARSGGLLQKVRQGMEDFRDVEQQLTADLGRCPTLEETAERMHISAEEAERYQAMIQKARQRQAVDTALEEKQEDPQEEEQAVEDTAYFQARERTMEMLDTLAPDEVRLLTLRFGLDGELPMTPQEAGGQLGLTSQEVVEKEAEILKKLRQQA